MFWETNSILFFFTFSCQEQGKHLQSQKEWSSNCCVAAPWAEFSVARCWIFTEYIEPTFGECPTSCMFRIRGFSSRLIKYRLMTVKCTNSKRTHLEKLHWRWWKVVDIPTKQTGLLFRLAPTSNAKACETSAGLSSKTGVFGKTALQNIPRLMAPLINDELSPYFHTKCGRRNIIVSILLCLFC